MFNVMQCEYSAMPAKLKSEKQEEFGRNTWICHGNPDQAAADLKIAAAFRHHSMN
jgi:hypothetical protein